MSDLGFVATCGDTKLLDLKHLKWISMMYKDYAYRCATLQECCEKLKDRLVIMSDRTKNLMADYKELDEHDRLLAKQNKLLWRQNALLRERCEILQKKLNETKN